MTSTDPGIPVAVSACLMGWKVRYDGRDKSHAGMAALLDGELLPLPVCPEVAVGLGVPRSPLVLVGGEKGVRIVGKQDRTLDVTDALIHYAEKVARQHPHIAGMICKSRSPSCGIEVALHDRAGAELARRVQGRFVSALQECLPGLPVIEETAIDEGNRWQEFIAAVRIFSRHR